MTWNISLRESWYLEDLDDPEMLFFKWLMRMDNEGWMDGFDIEKGCILRWGIECPPPGPNRLTRLRELLTPLMLKEARGMDLKSKWADRR